MCSNEEEYREVGNQPIAYNEDEEAFYIVDLNKYGKMKYLGYDKENNSLRYTRNTKNKQKNIRSLVA